MYQELPWEQPFLAALARLGVVTQAARAAGVGRTTVETRRRNHPECPRRRAAPFPSTAERPALIDRTTRPGPDSPKAQWRTIFLQALAESSNVSASAAKANVTTASLQGAARGSRVCREVAWRLA
jgi:hypothetical protein